MALVFGAVRPADEACALYMTDVSILMHEPWYGPRAMTTDDVFAAARPADDQALVPRHAHVPCAGIFRRPKWCPKNKGEPPAGQVQLWLR